MIKLVCRSPPRLKKTYNSIYVSGLKRTELPPVAPYKLLLATSASGTKQTLCRPMSAMSVKRT